MLPPGWGAYQDDEGWKPRGATGHSIHSPAHAESMQSPSDVIRCNQVYMCCFILVFYMFFLYILYAFLCGVHVLYVFICSLYVVYMFYMFYMCLLLRCLCFSMYFHFLEPEFVSNVFPEIMRLYTGWGPQDIYKLVINAACDVVS